MFRDSVFIFTGLWSGRRRASLTLGANFSFSMAGESSSLGEVLSPRDWYEEGIATGGGRGEDPYCWRDPFAYAAVSG